MQLDDTGDIRPATLAVVGVVGALVTAVIIVGLQVWYLGMVELELRERDLARPPQEIIDLTAEQQAHLSEYRWVDEEERIVRLPIERAMALVVNAPYELPPQPEKRPATATAPTNPAAPTRPAVTVPAK